MHAATEILRILVTGIVAIVPSAKHTDVTRLIAPNDVHMSSAHATVPDHYAFLDMPEANYKPVDNEREPDFRYENPRDDKQHVVFVLRSEKVELERAPSNLKHEPNPAHPSKLTAPKTAAEATSMDYEVDMGKVCPRCGEIKNEYFDIAKNPELVAARMDLRGGRESVTKPHLNQVWKIGPLKQPVAQEVVFAFDVPEGERLVLTGYQDKKTPKKTYISVVSHGNAPIDVTFGNSPLGGIMLIGAKFPASKNMEHDFKDHHFVLMYDLYRTKPRHRPLPELQRMKKSKVEQPFTEAELKAGLTFDLRLKLEYLRGVNPIVDDCVGGKMPKQDPVE